MRIFVFLLAIFFINKIYAQTDTVARVDIIAGSSLTMHFNSMDKIKNGIEYVNWTRLNANFTATNAGVATAAKWKLSVRSNTLDIVGDAGNIIDTRTVQIMANSGGVGSDQGWKSLTNSDVVLVNNGSNPVSSSPIIISYRCGFDPLYLIVGQTNDYYVVDLIFTLELL